MIAARIAKAGLRMQLGRDVEVCNPEGDPRFRQYWEHYHQLMKRNGASIEVAKAAVRRSNTIIASLMVTLGDADAMICGLVGTYETHLERIHSIIGRQADARDYATLNALMTNRGTLFIADTYVNEDPTAQQLADIAVIVVSADATSAPEGAVAGQAGAPATTTAAEAGSATIAVSDLGGRCLLGGPGNQPA